MATERGMDQFYDTFSDAFGEMQNRIYKMARTKGWWDEPRSIGDLLALIHSEISEALEEFRNGHEPELVYYSGPDSNKPEGLFVELADAIIRILDMAGYYQVDLAEILIEKVAFNETRPHRHGGKAL